MERYRCEDLESDLDGDDTGDHWDTPWGYEVGGLGKHLPLGDMPEATRNVQG